MSVLQISKSSCGDRIAPGLFGCNMEVTRSTFWHGLSAQMLANRKFFAQQDGMPCAWKLYGAVCRREENGKACLHMNGNAEIEQACLGAAVQSGESYQLSLLLEAEGEFEVEAQINGISCAHAAASFSGQPEEISLSFRAEADWLDPMLRLSIKGTGCIKLYAVSLLPEDHYFGMRRDVLEKLRTLAPSALRFPGGCYAECYPWKEGILSPNRRPVIHTDLYQGDFLLRNTFSQDCFEMNIDEFMRLCEYVGAAPELTLPLIRQPLQDAVDLVEYCRGAADTKWGALRAERGHPAPYPVKEWYIGNEIYYFGGELAEDGALAADKTIEMAEKIKQIDPECSLVLGFCPHNAEWTGAYLSRAGYLADKLSLHFYQTNEMEKNYHQVTDEMRSRVLEDYFIPELRCAKQLAEEIGCGHIPFSLDEWGYCWGEPGSPESMLVDSLLMAFLTGHAAEWNIQKALYFHPVNEGMILVHAADTEWDYFGAVFQMFSALRGKQKLNVTEDASLYGVAGLLRPDTVGVAMPAGPADASVRFESELFPPSSAVKLYQMIPDGARYSVSVSEGTAADAYSIFAGAAAFVEITSK